MKIVVKILLVVLVAQNILAQNTTVFTTASDVFKTYEKNRVFLKERQVEVDTINSTLSLLLSDDYKNKIDSILINKQYVLLQNSFTKFTNFNSKQLATIATRIKGVYPIRGSEISYLNQSFKLFVVYENTFDKIRKAHKHLLQSYNDEVIKDFFFKTRIGKLSYFYKNYYTAIENLKIRRVLNAEDKSYHKEKNELRKLVKALFKRKNYKKIQKSIGTKQCSSIETALCNTIKNNSYKKSRIKRDKKLLQSYFHSDNIYKFNQFFTHQISGAIGNFLGMFRFRKGYLYHNDSVILKLTKQLQPMDILAEKTGFALTDKLIPGHFGHIALWLGTEKQLKEQGLWDNPILQTFHNRIQSGYTILETDRGGTHLKTLKKFMNVDEIAIARINGFSKLPTREKIDLYQNAFGQLGKKYDFNFDVETSDKLVCSELLYQVFGAIHWPTDTVLKRATISPDNVLSLILYKNSPIQLSYYLTVKNRKRATPKKIDNLAKNLGFCKQKNTYVFPVEKCQNKYLKTKEKWVKQCKTEYHQLEYK